MASVQFTDRAREALHSLHIGNQQRIKAAAKDLGTNPYLGEALKERLQGFYSLHVGKYRAIYSIEGEVVTIHYVGHRREVYKTFRG